METTQRSLWYLLISSAIISLAMLQSNELWTMESRWATVCHLMIYKHDYLHAYLFNGPYLDKPLFSYWLIVILAKLFGNLNEWALRLPSALAGIGAIYCTYCLGKKLFNAPIGIIAGWLLTTNYFFVFWARTASADMLNVAGIILALTWYFEHRDQPARFINYLILFLVMTLTSLCKGLMGFVIPSIGILLDLTLSKKWHKHINWNSIVAFVISLMIYILPFMLTALTNDGATSSASIAASASSFTSANGLYEVFRENIQRYIAPFDHKDPFYTYFISLPIYLLPWTMLLFFAIKPYITQWQQRNYFQRWLAWFSLILFAFFTFSGSRRGYYILPLVPFITLLIADWLQNYFCAANIWKRTEINIETSTEINSEINSKKNMEKSIKINPEKSTKRATEENTSKNAAKNIAKPQHYQIFRIALISFYIILFSWFAIIRPQVSSTKMRQLAIQLNNLIAQSTTLKHAKIMVLNNNDHSLIFYLHTTQPIETIDDKKLRNILLQRSANMNETNNKFNRQQPRQQPLIIVATGKELPVLQEWFLKSHEPYEILTADAKNNKNLVAMRSKNKTIAKAPSDATTDVVLVSKQ